MNDSARQIVYYSTYSSPIGELMLTSDGKALTGLRMSQHRGRPATGPKPDWHRNDSVFQEIREQLKAYFEGDLRDFALPLAMAGTPFQQQVWAGFARFLTARP